LFNKRFFAYSDMDGTAETNSHAHDVPPAAIDEDRSDDDDD
jgi:hypothetical protein